MAESQPEPTKAQWGREATGGNNPRGDTQLPHRDMGGLGCRAAHHRKKV